MRRRKEEHDQEGKKGGGKRVDDREGKKGGGGT